MNMMEIKSILENVVIKNGQVDYNATFRKLKQNGISDVRIPSLVRVRKISSYYPDAKYNDFILRCEDLDFNVVDVNFESSSLLLDTMEEEGGFLWVNMRDVEYVTYI